MKRYCFPLLLVSLVLVFNGERATAAPPPPSPVELQAIEEAIRREITGFEQKTYSSIFFTTQISNLHLAYEQTWATAELVQLDPGTGNPIPTEPGLAIAIKEGESWDAFLPGDEGWDEALADVPEDLLSVESKEYWLLRDITEKEQASAGPFTGFRLPWANGKLMYMTQSVHHDRYDSTRRAHYAFDFAAPGYPSGMWEVRAAKAGRVVRFYDGVKNGVGECKTPNIVNYLVIEDPTTSPITYHLYLHLAQNSIPDQLKVKGAWVEMGQMIGVADNTGCSSGSHLHFQVHTNPNSYYGSSVDITFSDVAINGGRPRNRDDLDFCLKNDTFQDVCTATSETYISGNVVKPGDTAPPVGSILTPGTDGEQVTSNSLLLEGYATDGQSGLESAQFIARWGDTWEEIGPIFSNVSFTYDWDLCRSEVPDGPVSLALKLEDLAGNTAPGLPGLRHFIKQASCEPPPPPTCSPTAGQVALYSGVGYTGDCQVYGVDNAILSSELGAIEAAQAVSIRVGVSVQATVYAGGNLSGRGETFTADDPNLSDNRIGAKTLSSLKVGSRTANAFVPRAVYPPAGAVYSGSDIHNSWSLSWDDAGYGSEFQARIRRGGTVLFTSPWQADAFWHLGDLAPGVYEWQVRARNSQQAADSVEPTWPAIWNQFEIRDSYASARVERGSEADVGTQYTFPFTYTMEGDISGWETSQNWDLTSVDHRSGSYGWAYDANVSKDLASYDTGRPNAGSLTTPAIDLPAGETYTLRFWYVVETESAGRHWDQRWVQLSVDGGPFTNLLQLGEDPVDYWLQSPPIDLSPYAGHAVRLRFYFATLDARDNAHKGWKIDDLTIETGSPSCAQADTDQNTPASAAPLSVGSAVEAAICPAGDLDYFSFHAEAGEMVQVALEAQSLKSGLDPQLELLAPDGASVLAENDDLVPFNMPDSGLTFTAPQAGAYYLKVRAWDHPSGGGEAYFYRLRLVSDAVPPTAGIDLPTSSSTVSVTAQDEGSGVRQVEFYWHSGDWLSGEWQWLGYDTDGSDGWSFSLKPEQAAGMRGGALFIRARDWGGNLAYAGYWDPSLPFGIHLPLLAR